MRMKHTWKANTIPDLDVDISKLAQAIEDYLHGNYKIIIKRLNTAIKYDLNKPAYMKYPRADHNSFRMFGYSDAAFANNADLSLHFG